MRILLLLATNQDWSLLQFDVKNAFLHGDILEEIYMENKIYLSFGIVPMLRVNEEKKIFFYPLFFKKKLITS